MAELFSTYYEQDVVKPSAIFHGFDFGDDPEQNGNFGHMYNFLDYYFEEDGVQINARHYLDEGGKLSIIDTDPGHLASDFGQRVLMFLMMRYDNIEAGFEPLQDDLFKIVQARLATHMRQFP